MSENTREHLEKKFAQSCRKMEQLMKRIPQMNEQNAKWKRMKDTEELLMALRAYERLEEERAFMQKEEQAYAKAGKTGMSAYIQSQMGYRQGPLNETWARCQTLKEKTGFETREQAEKWLDSCGDITELEREIQDYQKEYNETLKLCQELDQELSACEKDQTQTE